jgi:hypothetical protein
MGAENQVKAFISVSLHTNNRDTKQICGHNPSLRAEGQFGDGLGNRQALGRFARDQVLQAAQTPDFAEPVIGRAFARPVGFIRATFSLPRLQTRSSS